MRNAKIKKSNITFYRQTDIEVDGQITGTDLFETIKCKGFAYRGSISKAYTSERFKADVSATLIIDFKDYTQIVSEGDKVVVDNFGTFSVIFADNVANQNMIVQIPCKEFT